MKQLELDYQAHNYTDTSKSAWANKKDKLTKREQVFEYIKLVSSISSVSGGSKGSSFNINELGKGSVNLGFIELIGKDNKINLSYVNTDGTNVVFTDATSIYKLPRAAYKLGNSDGSHLDINTKFLTDGTGTSVASHPNNEIFSDNSAHLITLL